jgi:hypothetical protein
MGRRLGLLAWIAPLVAAAVAAALGTRDPADLPYFAHAARTLFSAEWADTFADPALQVGPVFLALVGLVDRIGGLDLLAYVIQLGVTALLVVTMGRLLRDRRYRLAAQGLTGVAAVALGMTQDAYAYGHPAQMVVPLLWLLAGLDAREDRAGRAGALIGLSAGFELWGVLGAPILVLAPAVRGAVRGFAIQSVVILALYLPFVFAGEFRMFELGWKVEEWTLVRFLIPAGDDFPWTLRLVQGGLALAFGAALALALRRSPRAVWAVPLGIVGVRVLLDPALYSWYWLGVATLALAAAAELATSLRPRLTSVPGEVPVRGHRGSA